MSEYYDDSPPHACERLARIEGQTNYWRLLANQEDGIDTTEDMAALAMSRRSGVPPEFLEAYWGGSVLHRKALCLMVFKLLPGCGLKIRDKDRVWVLGACIDAFDRACGKYTNQRGRAAKFRVRLEDYIATRKLVEGLIVKLIGDVQPAWIRARFRRE